MYRCEAFREPWNCEDILTASVENFLNNNRINREDIVDIKYSTNKERIYCMIIWEDN